MLVSFIIPSYNSAPTVKRCIDSIYALSLKPEEFEVIFVDDASTDNTVDTIDQYRSKMHNVSMSDVCNLTLLRQPENHRQGAARNRGVKVAQGEYICFVDSDDTVSGGIVTAIRMAKEKQMDMVALHSENANELGETTSEIQKMKDLEGKVFSGIEMQNTYPYWCSAPWGFIYRRAFLEEVNYPFAEDVLYEDSDFVAVHLYHAKRMAYSPELGYRAYYREGSTTHHTSYKNVADYLLLGVRMMRFYERIKAESGKRKVEGVELFADGILEGACYNVMKSCKRLIKLGNIKEVRAYYDRVDEQVSRNEICTNTNFHKYYWNWWISLCLHHKQTAVVLLAVLIPMYKLIKR